MFQLTAARLREVLHYDSETGAFTWRVTNSRRKVAGSPAGCKHKRDGRIYIGIDGRLYKAHRLAWLYVHGEWPPAGVDHRDGVSDHNWIGNLRPATQAQNMQNLKAAHADNKTGFLGVQKTRSGRWFARIRAGGISVFGKKFDTPAEAHASYLEIKRCFHPFSTI